MRARGRPQKYPWDTWLDGTDRLLIRGSRIDEDHFDGYTDPASLRRQIRARAAERDMDVRVTAEAGGDIGIRFTGGGRSKYDWDKLLDGREHHLTMGEEVRCTIDSFRQLAYRAAKRRGESVSVQQRGEMVKIQSLGLLVGNRPGVLEDMDAPWSPPEVGKKPAVPLVSPVRPTP